MSPNKHVEHDATEFGLHIRQGGWRLGLLVARSVEPSKGGRPATKTVKDPDGKDPDGKVSARHFADQAKVSVTTVMMYFKAWNLAAADDIVPFASELVPGEELSGLEVSSLPGDWADYFEPINDTAGANRSEYAQAAKDAGVETSTVINVGRKRGAIEAAIQADPEVAKAARRALDKRAKRDAEAYYENASVPREDLEAKIAADEAEDKRFNEMWDDLLKDADRISTLRQLQRVAEIGRDKMQAIVNDSTPTGVESEIDMLHKTIAALMDWQWAASSYIFDPATK